MKNNKNIHGFDLDRYKKVEDIIFLDEPILTHYRRNNKDFLWYLVDTEDNNDIFLFLEVEVDSIFKYLIGKLSLLEIITSNENICYIIKQDFNGNIIDSSLTYSELITGDYLPEKESYLDYLPSEDSYYFEFINEYEAKLYLNHLRENAFYLKIGIKNKKYADTIGFNDLANSLLVNISSSYKHFLKSDFFESFKNTIVDGNKLQRIYSKILPDLDFRMVDLKYGSFEIGLSVDKVMKDSIEDRKIREWAKGVGNKYQELVLTDYNPKNVDTIIKSFNENDRKKIFNPIFKITENSDFKLSIKAANKTSYSLIHIKDKSTIETIIPPQLVTVDVNEKDFQIVNLTTVLDKNKKQKTINLEETLFDSPENAEVLLKNKDFEKHGYKLKIIVSIPVKISTEKSLFIIKAIYDDYEFVIEESDGKFDNGIQRLTHKIYEYILNKE